MCIRDSPLVVVRISGLGEVPMAIITLSTGNSKLEPSIATGDVYKRQELGDIYPAAGTSSTAVKIDFDSLVRITGGTPCDVIAK